MSAPGWSRLEDLFHTATTLPPSDRAAFLDSECGGDAALRAELESLLRNDAPPGTGFEDAIRQEAEIIAEDQWFIGRRAGAWRITGIIGQGGMGAVYEAVRDDDQYQKRAAVKLVRRGMESETLLQRFRAERQILASLEHPYIARLLDGGATAGGHPYLVMELVAGVPITRYVSEHNLPIEQRLRLFQKVCEAVQYAHQSLVVHRDLKPANVLVTEDGVPKLLDFGIAKLLTPLDEDSTVTHIAPWTPDYASPEQVRAQPVTTRTDVYSLGLILFEMLTGERAQTADKSSPLALDHSICEVEPPPASARAAACGNPTLTRKLRGDLDTIIAMAIRKEPGRRYGSAAALSDDVERYLKGRPVRAHPGTMAYRAWKLVRRHRIGVAAALLIAGSVTGGIAATIHQARRAERRFQQVRKLANSLLFNIHDRLQNIPGAIDTREWAVKTVLEYVDDLSKDAGSDQSIWYDMAGAYLRIGDVQGYGGLPNLGHREAAMMSYQKARAIAERLAASDPDPKIQRLLVRSYQCTGAMFRAFHQLTASNEEFHRALAVAERLYAADPADPRNAAPLSSILSSLAGAENTVGNLAEARRLWLRAAEISERSAAGNPTQVQLVRTGKHVIRAAMFAGDLDTAERIAREGVEIWESRAANPTSQREMANAYGDLGYVYFHPYLLSLDDRRTAAIFQEKSLAIARRLAAADPKNVTAQSDLFITTADVCAALIPSDPAKAIEYCRESIAVGDALQTLAIPEEPLGQLADGLQRLGRHSEALAALRSAMQERERFHKEMPEHFPMRQQLLRGHNQMAGLLLEMGDTAGALAEHRQAVAMAEELAAAIPTNLLSRRDLADTYEAFGKYYEGREWAQARAWYQKSLDIWTAWPNFAKSSRMDRERRIKAEAAVARCTRT
jgi:tetratricopeptide (TPR) repeat protein